MQEQGKPPERYLVVRGRRWRREDPALPDDVATRLRSHLGRGRSAVGAAKRADVDPAPHRVRVDLAKHGLGERGTPWWEQSGSQRQHRWEAALRELDALDQTPVEHPDEQPHS
ncbi:MAG: 2-polyprenylphenol hydroxylase [Ornithinimicrobium sp.]